MDTPSDPRLFSDAALAVLDRMPYDPSARGRFEIMSGGLMWPDEFPRIGTPEFAAIAPGCLYRFLLAYRASITLHPELAQPYVLWEQVARHAQNWPGLRPERRGEQAQRRLRAALRRQEKCLAELESHLEVGRSDAERGSAPDLGRM
jgi:hypothetical protein